ncbi:TIGR00288 family NYN domain-containing protein [Candidatus Nanohalococcus occultus]|uniref:NYN domain containing protein, LabA family n=1 Tax=Candidatus Nanohalococcus occultus TaxID=2978047 RepID=A0ABY8CEP7_9ARCH|nr:putative NYN domain containing protein, LabA family [Candidatus Nanohaloarchaeota archaeon SVXNc]
MVFERVKSRVDNKPNVAVYVDGPNVIRKEFDLDLDRLREEVEELGHLKIGKVFLNQYASEKLIEAIVSQGFEAALGLGGEKDKESDVDVYMAVNAMEAVFNDSIDTVVIVTRDTDFLPVIQKAKEHGKKTVVVGMEPGFSTALKNAADKVIELE